MTNRQSMEWVARGFFVWLSVFNCSWCRCFEFHGRSVYAGPGARLFGVIAAGGRRGPVRSLITTGLTMYLSCADPHAGLGAVSDGLHLVHLLTGGLGAEPVRLPSRE